MHLTNTRSGGLMPHPSTGQLDLPFLTADDVASIDAACQVVEAEANRAVMRGKPLDAAHYDEIAVNLRRILERHAAAYRSGRRR
jgi:hypothetical protein